jgi:sugar fermentation stimulation protein A
MDPMSTIYDESNGRLSVYSSFERTAFISRESRFTLLLKHELESDTIRAYLPGTGRMEEYLVRDHPFFIVPFFSKKFSYRVVSTLYQGNYVLIDTSAVQHIVHKLLKSGKPVLPDRSLLPGDHLTREKTIGKSRFDFLLERENETPVVLEIKSCTLCHNETALFPDAPSARALQHVSQLETLGGDNKQAHMVFAITNGAANRFFLNFHTDPAFSTRAAAAQNVRFSAISIPLVDPVTIHTAGIRQIPIDWKKLAVNNGDCGGYILVLKNSSRKVVRVGRLGDITFKKGYYAYVGSALKSLSNRVHRHGIKTKKKHWHIDYIVPTHMQLEKTYLIRRRDRIEAKLAERFTRNCDGYIDGFGASDSAAPSHLFYFTSSPAKERFFQDAVLDFRTFTEK